MPLKLAFTCVFSEHGKMPVMSNSSRFKVAAKAAIAHFCLSVLVALIAAGLVFGLWFPGAYRDMAGGTELFLLIVIVDMVCGPLLTLVLFNPLKSRRELFLDLGLVALVQLAALMYGLWTLWDVRPLYFPHEFDRFKVVSLNDLRGADIAGVPLELQPGFFKGPITVGLREPRSPEERNKVLFAALSGGADYGERPDFYVPFDAAAAQKTLARSRPVKDFIIRYPAQKYALEKISSALHQPIDQMRYLPITARKNWIAVLTPDGQIADFVPGDGF
jgi:hypothetical protein